MSAPKSVVKTLADGQIEYTSMVEKANYYLFELTRAALRDVGRYITKKFRISYYQHFKRHSGDAGRATRYHVISNKYTEYPRVQIGLKTGQVDGFYAYFQEFGAKGGSIPKLGLLTHAAKDNIAEIIKIESQYLSGLSGEAERLESLIDEGDYEDDED